MTNPENTLKIWATRRETPPRHNQPTTRTTASTPQTWRHQDTTKTPRTPCISIETSEAPPRQHRVTSEAPPGHHEGTTETPSKEHNAMQTPSRRHRKTTKTSLGHHQYTTKESSKKAARDERKRPARNQQETSKRPARNQQETNKRPAAASKRPQRDYQDTTETPRKHRQDTTEASPRHKQDTTWTPPGHHRDTTETPPRYQRDTTETPPPRHRRDTTKIPPRHHRDTTETPPRHHQDTTETPHQDTTETPPRYHRDTTDTPPWNHRDTTETPRQRPGRPWTRRRPTAFRVNNPKLSLLGNNETPAVSGPSLGLWSGGAKAHSASFGTMRQDLTGLAPKRFEESWIYGLRLETTEHLIWTHTHWTKLDLLIHVAQYPCRAVSIYLKYLKTNIVAMLAALSLLKNLVDHLPWSRMELAGKAK